MIRAYWRWVVGALSVLLILVSLVVGPYLAAEQATQASIRSAEAAQNSKAAQAQAAKIQQAVQYLITEQKAAPESRQELAWLVEQVDQICGALSKRPSTTGKPLPSCQIVPLPPPLAALVKAHP